MVQHTRNRGQVIVELLVAFALAGILLPALLTGLIGARSGRVQQEQRILAVGLLREGEEAIRSVRNVGWDKITSPTIIMDTPYHWVQGLTAWSLVAGSETKEGFTRSIVISDISPPDPSLKKITITVSWGGVLPLSTSSTIYLTRWKNLLFSPLAANGPLKGQGYGDWCNPSTFIVGSYNLGSIPIAITANASATLNMPICQQGETPKENLFMG